MVIYGTAPAPCHVKRLQTTDAQDTNQILRFLDKVPMRSSKATFYVLRFSFEFQTNNLIEKLPSNGNAKKKISPTMDQFPKNENIFIQLTACSISVQVL